MDLGRIYASIDCQLEVARKLLSEQIRAIESAERILFLFETARKFEREGRGADSARIIDSLLRMTTTADQVVLRDIARRLHRERGDHCCEDCGYFCDCSAPECPHICVEKIDKRRAKDE